MQLYFKDECVSVSDALEWVVHKSTQMRSSLQFWPGNLSHTKMSFLYAYFVSLMRYTAHTQLTTDPKWNPMIQTLNPKYELSCLSSKSFLLLDGVKVFKIWPAFDDNYIITIHNFSNYPFNFYFWLTIKKYTFAKYNSISKSLVFVTTLLFLKDGFCCVLTFWAGQKCHSRWCTGRKWYILMAVMRGNRVGGNWLMKWDELKIFPWYTTEWCTGREWPLNCSYFRLMTIKHSISKIEWASNDYIIHLSSTSQCMNMYMCI